MHSADFTDHVFNQHLEDCLYREVFLSVNLNGGGRPAVFRGERRELLMQVMDDDPRQPRRIRPWTPRYQESICLKAMCKSPSRR